MSIPKGYTEEPIEVRAVNVTMPFHGARGGAPKGERNGMYRHGLYTAKAADKRRRLRDFLVQVRETIAGIS